ncbi:hypothetical protein D3C77_584970 [compost metagenome]
MFAVWLEQVAAVARVAIFISEDASVAGVHLIQVFHGAGQEASGAAGRIANDVGRLRRDQLDYGVDDMPRRTELAVDTSGGELAQQVFVNIALNVALSQRQVIDHLHGGGQY